MPAESVISLPKCPKQLEDGAALGRILSSKSPEMWRDACDPKHLMMISGNEGKSVYCSFSVEDHPSEERFIRLVAPNVCDRLFPKLLEELNADPTREPKNERQRQRKEVLNWRPTDIKNGRIQLNPEFEMWERCREPDLKSCLKMPVPRPIKRGRDELGELPPGVKSIQKVEVTTSFKVFQRPGAVYVLQFDDTTPVSDAALES